MATHTINYTDILSFKNKSKVKDHNATIKKIFDKISDIINNILDDKFVIIAFDEEVEFVDPIFFILLFDLYYEYQFTLVIDIRYMDTKSQHYIHRMLTQYSDLDGFQIYSPYIKKNEEAYKKISDIAKTDEEERARQFKILLDKKSIHLFSDVVHRKSLIYDSQYEYSLLPILKLRNFKLQKIEIFEHEDSLDPYDTRIDFYNKLSLYQAKQNVEKYRVNLHDKIEKLLNAVGLENRGLSVSFRDIFFELIDNIRKHTPESTSAHISFRKDQKSYLYELIIADNNPKGFINTYRETLSKEQERLKKSGVKEELLKNYTDVIRDIDEKNYKKVLTGLFQIQKNGAKNSKTEEMHIHQIPRIAMHFGLPLLVKLLEKISQQKSKTTPELKLFLHNQDKYFEITYKFNDGSSTLHINDNSEHKKVGTYIIITFPENVKIDIDLNSDDKELTSINRDNDEYNQFIDNQDKISSQINEFSFYLDKHLERDLNINLEYTYAPKDKYIFVKYTGKYTFSEFIRTIYLYAYKYDIEDIVVFNVPLFNNQDNSENIEHLRLLESIMYGNLKVPYEKSLNILFYSDREPEAILIGGRNQKEYCYLNQLLPSWYETHNKNSICIDNHEPSVKLLSSKLFIELDRKNYLLPFELFEISDEDRRNDIEDIEKETVFILEGMLEKYLNEVAKIDGIHIDTGTGYHIDRFMEFKKVFEDSRWVKRLAFRLAMQFPKNPKDKKYYLYGTDKYTNMLISLCYSFLNLDFDRFRYKLFNIYDPFDYKVLKEKIKKLNDKKTHEIYLVSSVIVNAEKDIELINNFKIKAISAIQLNMGKKLHDAITPIVSIKNYGNIEKIDYKIKDNKIKGEYCKKCSGKGVESRKVPLLEFTDNDPFFIKDTFFDTIQKKNIQSYCDKEKINVKWFDSLNFGHVERGNNHFLYYINTIKFFNQNRYDIEDFLSDYVAKEVKYNKKEKIVLLTSSHDTNNNFVTLVNQKVFDNEAIVLSFNKSRGEANFHDLDSYKFFDWTNTRVFFVDDSIASSHTIKYFYQMLRSIPEIMDKPNIGLDGVIIMIDRISSYDETILCSYLKDSDQINKPNQEVQKDKLEAIYAFTTFDIKPIKSEVEECFLCKRNKRYIELAQKSALDLTTFQMVRRAYKLRNIEYRAIQPAKTKPLVDRFKTYLKAMATIYIYQKFAGKSYDEFGKFDDMLQTFAEKIYSDLLEDKKDRFEKYDQNLLKSIIKFQSEIALIKALSSPRLSYYYDIRKWLINVIFYKLKIEVNKVINQDFNFEYKFAHETFEKVQWKISIQKQTFYDFNYQWRNFSKFDGKDISFLTFYGKMTNLHLINVYFATLGYFEDSKILDTDYIRFFYKITQNKDVRNFPGDSLLHTYPFAVKFTIADNLEKATYFEQNINEVFPKTYFFERKQSYSYMNALKIENTLFWKSDIKLKAKVDIPQRLKELSKEKELDKKIEKIKDIFMHIFAGSRVYLFISPYATIVPSSYKSYLDNSEKSLINILDSYKSIDSYDKSMLDIVQKVFYGAVDKQVDTEGSIDLQKLDRKNVIDKISDTWANDYDDKYCVVRLATIDEKTIENYNKNGKQNKIIDNDPVWFRPIGCIVVENSSMDYSLHMEISRTILSIKNYMTSYIEKEFSYGTIQEAIGKEVVKEKLWEHFMDILVLTGHSFDEVINIEEKIEDFLKKNPSHNQCLIYLSQLQQFSWGLNLLAKLPKLIKKEQSSEEIYIWHSLQNFKGKYTEFIEKLIQFTGVANIFTTKVSGSNIQLKVNIQAKNLILPIDVTDLEIILFELVFNAMKRIEDDNSSITIGLNGSGIYVKNTFKDKEEAKNYEKSFMDSLNGESKRTGIRTISEFLKKVDYVLDMKYDDISQEMIVSIKQEE